MLVIILLIIISIFFPPAWFALIAYIIYLALTKKERRNRVIMFEIQKLILSGKEETILKHLYYDAAKSFAAEHGASMSLYKNDPEDDCLIIDMVVAGKEYSVCVQRWMKDETMLTVKTKSKAKADLVESIGKDSFLAEILEKDLELDKSTSEAEGSNAQSNIVENITQGVNSRIGSKKTALQFVLEELDAARQGNAAAIQFVKKSGFSPAEYEGALQNSFEEVDGPNGPQQFLLSSAMQYSSDMDFMVNLRLQVVENIINIWQLNTHRESKPSEDITKKQDEIISELSRMSESSNDKSYKISIMPVKEVWSWEFEFSEEELEIANELIASLSELRNGDFIAPISNIEKNKKSARSFLDDFDEDIPF